MINGGDKSRSPHQQYGRGPHWLVSCDFLALALHEGQNLLRKTKQHSLVGAELVLRVCKRVETVHRLSWRSCTRESQLSKPREFVRIGENL